jgi:uncharacterized membrane protein (DUF2068 family)
VAALLRTDKPRGAGHDKFWLRLIGLGKLLKAVVLLALAIGVLRLVNTGFGDEMAQLAGWMRYSPESTVLRWLLDKASLLSDKRLHQVAAAAGIYSCMEFVEAYGLLRRRLWGEYLTFVLTCAFLPLDIYELALHFTWTKLAFTIFNVLAAWYLAWHIKRKQQMRARATEGN